MKRTTSILAITIALLLCGPIARSQEASTCSRSNTDACTAQTFNISNITDRNDIYNNIVSALRSALHRNDDISMVSSSGHNAIIVRGIPDDLEVAQKVITDLDRPKKNYRLTYTVTEMDGGKQIGTQHYAMIMTSDQQTSLKLGNRVPVVTGPAGSQNAQYTYIDIGMDFDATLTEMGNNAMLKSSVEQSSVAPEKSDVGGGVQQPVVRQATLKGESLLAPGKSVMLGSVDIPGSTSHLQIEVVMEPLP
jgi:type II secretory pathway component GspD/PulD (secretin)